LAQVPPLMVSGEQPSAWTPTATASLPRCHLSVAQHDGLTCQHLHEDANTVWAMALIVAEQRQL
jgi:hypothetical protein